MTPWEKIGSNEAYVLLCAQSNEDSQTGPSKGEDTTDGYLADAEGLLAALTRLTHNGEPTFCFLASCLLHSCVNACKAVLTPGDMTCCAMTDHTRVHACGGLNAR